MPVRGEEGQAYTAAPFYLGSAVHRLSVALLARRAFKKVILDIVAAGEPQLSIDADNPSTEFELDLDTLPQSTLSAIARH
eukprot:4574-Chlamydomonas_euryale.AAC.1